MDADVERSPFRIYAYLLILVSSVPATLLAQPFCIKAEPAGNQIQACRFFFFLLTPAPSLLPTYPEKVWDFL